MAGSYTMMINGEAVSGVETFDIVNPATSEVFAKAPDCTKEELDHAVAAAKAALPAWRKTTMDERRQ